jgi:hypothetical protein
MSPQLPPAGMHSSPCYKQGLTWWQWDVPKPGTRGVAARPSWDGGPFQSALQHLHPPSTPRIMPDTPLNLVRMRKPAHLAAMHTGTHERGHQGTPGFWKTEGFPRGLGCFARGKARSGP